ncbi:MAG TPA: cytochrome c [Anaeromyxobacteraceae bacterium]|nr:cytochrome c [Anaeromyxobacteraceae bacterium]
MVQLKVKLVIVGLALCLATSRAAAQGPDGKALYQQNCAACHGAKGVPAKGMLSVYPALKAFSDPEWAKFSPDSIAAVIRKGSGKNMRGFGDKLKPEQVTAIAAFVKTLATGAAPAP